MMLPAWVVVSSIVLFSSPLFAAQYTMRISHEMPENHFLSNSVREFKTLVEEKTGGRMSVRIYPAARAFAPKESINAVATGSIEAALVTSMECSGLVPTMELFLVPYLITQIPVIEKVFDGEAGSRLFAKLEAKGVTPIMWLLQTKCNVYTSKDKPLIMPADFKGKMIRGTSKMMNLGSEALGAAAVPVPGPEVQTALQVGMIDIGLTGPDAAFSRHYDKFHKYGTIVDNFSVVCVFFVNPKFWASLPADVQKAVQQSGKIVQKNSLEESEKFRASSIDELKKTMIIHEQTPQEVQAWRSVMEKPCLDYFLKTNGNEGAELVDLVRKIAR